MIVPLSRRVRKAPPADGRPAWAVRLAVASVLFLSIGAALLVGALAVNPIRDFDVLCAGATLVVCGAVLRSITSPVES